MMKEYNEDPHTLNTELQFKEVNIRTHFQCIVRSKAETAIAENEKEVLESTNDYLMGLIACNKSKKSMRIVGVLLSTFPDSFLGVALISEIYIATWALSEVMRLNQYNNTHKREWTGHSDILSIIRILMKCGVLFCSKSSCHFLLDEITIRLQI